MGEWKEWVNDVYRILRGSGRRNMRMLPEQKICIEIANFVRAEFLQGNLTCVAFHVPNESNTSKLTFASSMKKEMLTVPGVADYVFVGENKSIFMEVKTPRGPLSENQKIFKTWCENTKVPYFVVRSFEEARQVLMDEGMVC